VLRKGQQPPKVKAALTQPFLKKFKSKHIVSAEPACTNPQYGPHLKSYHSDREKVLSIPDRHLEEALDAINQGYTAFQKLRKLNLNSAFNNKSFNTEQAGLALVNNTIELRFVHMLLALIFPPVPVPLHTTSSKPINPSPITPTSWQSFLKVMSFLIPKSKDEETPQS
ncbi:hypothetical protein VP01_6031g1, partial [Puccinia sorghi]